VLVPYIRVCLDRLFSLSSIYATNIAKIKDFYKMADGLKSVKAEFKPRITLITQIGIWYNNVNTKPILPFYT